MSEWLKPRQHKVVQINVDYIAKMHHSEPECDVEWFIEMLSYGELITQDQDHCWVHFFDYGFVPVPSKYIDGTGETVDASCAKFGALINVDGQSEPISIAAKIALTKEQECK